MLEKAASVHARTLLLVSWLIACSSEDKGPSPGSAGDAGEGGSSSSPTAGAKGSAGGRSSGGSAGRASGAGGMGGSAGGASGAGGRVGSAGEEPTGGTVDAGGSGGTSNPPVKGGTTKAADLARKLGRAPNFLIGMGNDLPSDYKWESSGIYKLGAPLDLHYIYLTQGWQDWNAGGYFPHVIGTVDKAKGATPMASVWAITGQGENNFAVLVQDAYMNSYWEAAKLLMQRYGELDSPALVHLEPDFWAYAQQKSGGDPTSVPVHLAPECGDLPGDLSGMARCWFKLARTHAPKVVIGLHASEWAATSGKAVGEFLKKLGSAESDVVVIDLLDRDAGCFEDGQLDICKRGGDFYLDETNQKSPNFAERLSFAKQVSTATGKPILWWQIPFGVPSDKPGGTPGHFRDNKVHYVFNHIQEFVDAGGVGIAFGAGADKQTTPDTDGGQFKAAVQAYFAKPVPLP